MAVSKAVARESASAAHPASMRGVGCCMHAPPGLSRGASGRVPCVPGTYLLYLGEIADPSGRTATGRRVSSRERQCVSPNACVTCGNDLENPSRDTYKTFFYCVSTPGYCQITIEHRCSHVPQAQRRIARGAPPGSLSYRAHRAKVYAGTLRSCIRLYILYSSRCALVPSVMCYLQYG